MRGAPIAKGTLFPFGGQFSTHWEYLAARALKPSSVEAWIPVEDPTTVVVQSAI